MSRYQNLYDRIYQGVGEYDIPVIEPVYELSIDYHKRFTDFKRVKEIDKPKTCINFFEGDREFEKVWNNPNRFMSALRGFGCILSPDFSTYTDFPKALNIFNHYRKHWIAAYYQENGFTVVPTISWADKDSFDWCFDGEPEASIVAVSNVGCMKNKETRRKFLNGYNEMLVRLQPSKILFFAHTVDDYKGNVEYIKYNYEKL